MVVVEWNMCEERTPEILQQIYIRGWIQEIVLDFTA